MFEHLSGRDPRELSNLTLAYIGDSVFELYTRMYVLGKTKEAIKNIHRTVIMAVSAKGQAGSIRHILDILTEKEIEIFKRGRNTHTPSMAKNANAADYQTATGAEALIGYLYLAGEKERAAEIMDKMLEISLPEL